MYRGNDSFTTMKGFLGDMTIKGDGHELETLPPGEEGDITESAELDNALPGGALSAANIKPTDNKTGSPSTTMDPELDEVADKAVQDIAQGYDADVQNLPGPGDREKKGYEVYNDMVAKGAAINVQPFNRFDVDGSINVIEKSAQGAFELGLSQLSPWMTKGMDNDLSLKGLVFKGDPEDMSLEDGYVEDGAPNGSVEEADDDTESTQGENEEDPQSLAAETDDDEGDVANPATLADDGTQKGWASYNHGIAVKGFAMEEKGSKRALWEAGDLVAQGLLKAGQKLPVGYGGKTLTKLGRGALKHREAIGGGVAGAGTIGAGAAGVAAYKKGKKDKGFEDDMTVFKGASFSEMVVKGESLREQRAILNPKGKFKDEALSKRAWEAIKRGGKAVGRGASAVAGHVGRHTGKYGAAALGAGVAGAYAAGRSRKKGFGGMVIKGDWGFPADWDKSDLSASQREALATPNRRDILSRKFDAPSAPPVKAAKATTETAKKPGVYRRAVDWAKGQSAGRKVAAGLGAAALLGGGAYVASQRKRDR